MQLEGVLSTSQVAKNFMGTGLVAPEGVRAPAPVIVLMSLSVIAVNLSHGFTEHLMSLAHSRHPSVEHYFTADTVIGSHFHSRTDRTTRQFRTDPDFAEEQVKIVLCHVLDRDCVTYVACIITRSTPAAPLANVRTKT